MEIRQSIISESAHGMRLDRALVSTWPDVSRSRLQHLISESKVMVAGQIITDSAYKIAAGLPVTITLPPAVPLAAEPESIPLDIYFEDAHLLIVNKPVGLVVHPAAGNFTGTLVNAVLAHCGSELSGIGGVMRPGIVHRLDKDTSGLMVVAKTDAAHQSLTTQFQNRTVEREYMALVWGVPVPAVGKIEGNIGRHPQNRQKMAVVKSGKPAITHYQLMRSGLLASLVHCRLLSGRTHQIRVHMAHLGYPLVGDPVYGRRTLPKDAPIEARTATGQALHAATLGIIHPITGEELSFTAAPPTTFCLLQEVLGV